MLSTRFGYLRPAARARARASLFCSGESAARRFFGFVRFHGGRESDRDAIKPSFHMLFQQLVVKANDQQRRCLRSATEAWPMPQLRCAMPTKRYPTTLRGLFFARAGNADPRCTRHALMATGPCVSCSLSSIHVERHGTNGRKVVFTGRKTGRVLHHREENDFRLSGRRHARLVS
jgi:hypothetical protein